jgi:hypothetical protein
MGRMTKKTCDVTGITTSSRNFYSKQTHLKAVDNLRRGTGATKEQMRRMFNQLSTVR